jgi:hypothetical protein
MIKFFLSFIMVLHAAATVMAQKEDKSFDITFYSFHLHYLMIQQSKSVGVCPNRETGTLLPLR